MTFSKYREESRQIFTSLKIMNIYELNKYFIALFMYSYFNDELPSNFNVYFPKIHDQLQKYILTIRGLIMEYSSLSTGEHKYGIVCQKV